MRWRMCGVVVTVSSSVVELKTMGRVGCMLIRGLGRHDVGSLAKGGRHHSHTSHASASGRDSATAE